MRLAATVLLVACVPPRASDPAESVSVPAPSASASVESAPVAPAAVGRPVDLPAEVAGSLPGPVYLAVRGVGVVEVGDEGARVVLSTKGEIRGFGIDPDGGVWASYFDSGTARIRDGKATPITKQVYQRFAFRTKDDGYAAREDIEWSIDHYDGKAWKKGPTRRHFVGRYDDNKFQDLAVTPDALWVSSWNGLHRMSKNAWEKVAPPSGADGNLGPEHVLAFGNTVLICFITTCFAGEFGAFRPYDWPHDTLDAINGAGLIVGGSARAAPLVIGSVVAEGVNRSQIEVSTLDDKFIDAGGRTWVATDFKLYVLDAAGGVLSSWAPGTLAGIEGKIDRVVVRGRGPTTLPDVDVAKTYEVRGKLEVYKSGEALADATVRMCAGHSDCRSAAFHRSMVTAADGSFVFNDIPPAQLTISTGIPALPECGGIFRSGGLSSFDPVQDCASGSRVCDVGTIHVCTPFEMPPPR